MTGPAHLLSPAWQPPRVGQRAAQQELDLGVGAAQLVPRPPGQGDDEAAGNALRHLGEVAEFVKILGIYPAAKSERGRRAGAFVELA